MLWCKCARRSVSASMHVRTCVWYARMPVLVAVAVAMLQNVSVRACASVIVRVHALACV